MATTHISIPEYGKRDSSIGCRTQSEVKQAIEALSVATGLTPSTIIHMVLKYSPVLHCLSGEPDRDPPPSLMEQVRFARQFRSALNQIEWDQCQKGRIAA